ncbi:MAG: metal ABC transporter permease [Tenericutes bacterium]|nr:metal ABC transporter permease [Mycoplasmatota bacterium]
MILSFLNDLFTLDFMYRALIAGLILGILAPLIGSIVVVRRLSFIADTLGHFSLVGIAVSLFLSTLGISIFFERPLYLGIAFAVIGGFLIELFRRSYKNYKEISMVIVISLGSALSAIFFSLSKKTGSLYNYLFGSILTITDYYLVLIIIIAAIVIALFIIFWKQILSISFDETTAKFLGVNVGLFQMMFMILLSVVVSVLLEAAGVLLISSMMIIPVASAMRISWSFRSTLVISIVFSELSVFFGLWAAYSFKIPSGAAIVSVSIIILIIIAMVKRIVQKRNIANLEELQK